MKCPFCSSKTFVYNSRSSHQATQTWRRRKCTSCHKVFTTREKVDFDGTVRVASSTAGNNEPEPYSRDRLLVSIATAARNFNLPPGMLTELVDSIEITLKQSGFFMQANQPSTKIIYCAVKTLAAYNKNLALLYIMNVYNNEPPEDVMRQLTI